MAFDAGRICLDLLATSHPDERLDSAGALGVWIGGAGLVPSGTSLAHAEGHWVVRFQELRWLVRQLVLPGGTTPDTGSYGRALARLNDLARPAPPVPCAVRREDGRLARALAEPPSCSALLALVARDAVELLTDPVARAAVRECEGDNCPLVYLDTSRGRRRRWCSSEVCGNRERVARHRRRAALARA
ncbi:ABATE domain-containing protein [Streptomyces sp. FXJ1.172]|uniref:CGNR zinc finger domain-containing protein n=1 Tax=Streptomyces sp. FXJ1.172 TaxID=710705 RepID=UPI0007CF4EDB|nr:ABATE domain-containing protein [Streptomyces sp. FXJ1.172]WEO97118.1 ABATE domain-containing protein [Streptomyces sp. FXJ1.172]